MKDSSKNLLRVIGIINLILGLRLLISRYGWIVLHGDFEFLLESFRIPRNWLPQEIPLIERILMSLFGLIICPVIPLAKAITGGGIFFLKRWAFRAMLLVILVDFIIKFRSALLNCIYYCFIVRIDPSQFSKAIATMNIHMLPTYIIAFFDLFVLFVLTRETTRRYFESSQI